MRYYFYEMLALKISYTLSEVYTKDQTTKNSLWYLRIQICKQGFETCNSSFSSFAWFESIFLFGEYVQGMCLE